MSWKSFKKPTTEDLTTKAEYIATSDAAKEAVWLKKFITYLGVIPTILDPIILLCDKNGLIAQAKEPKSYQKSEHILMRFYLMREIIARGDAVMERVLPMDNVVDPLTMSLAPEVFERHCTTMRLMHKGD